MNRLKKIWNDTAGVALVTVLGIMTVVAILATGMFYFSTNELGFAKMDGDRATAQYLARAAVEIAAKTYHKVAGNFEIDAQDKPIVGHVYLHEYTDAAGKTAYQYNQYPDQIYAEDGTTDELVENANLGAAEVTVSKETRKVEHNVSGTTTVEEHDVWVYRAKAKVGKSSYTAQAFTAPVAKAYDAPLNLINRDGELQLTDNLGTIANQTTLITLIKQLFGIDVKITLTGGGYPGVLVADDPDPADQEIPIIRLNQSRLSENRVYAWNAQAIFIKQGIDLTNRTLKSGTNGLVLSAPVIVIDEEVNLYRFSADRLGSLALIPPGSQTNCKIYFNAPVYLYRSTLLGSREKIIEAGTAYEYSEAIDLIEFARNKEEYAEKFKKITAAAPTEESVLQIVWE